MFALPRSRIGLPQRHRAGFWVATSAALFGLTPAAGLAQAGRPPAVAGLDASTGPASRGTVKPTPKTSSQPPLPGETAPLRSHNGLGGFQADLAPQGGALSWSLQQVLERGRAVSLELNRSQRVLARDRALIDVNSAALRPRLGLIGMGSYTEVGTSVGFLSNLPTLGDLSLSLGQNGYAVLQNTFGNVGLVLDVNLLPLRQRAELAASRSELVASSASQRETERQVRFNLVSRYRQLQLQQALVPIWEQALLASSALERDAEAIRRRGLAPRIDVLRSRALRASDEQGLAQTQGELLNLRQQLAALLDLPPDQAPSAADPIAVQPAWPFDLSTSLKLGLQDRPLLQALEAQQKAQRQQAAAARALLQPSLWLLVGGGYSGDNLAVPVLNQGGSLNGPGGSGALPSQQLNGSLSGSFYNWGAALLVRQPLYDGGRSSAAVAVADRQRELLQSDEDLARRRIREDISAAWAALQTAPATIDAAKMAVLAGERALRDAQLRYRAQVETITEVLLVQRQLQASRAALATALTRQALDRAILERETEQPPQPNQAEAELAAPKGVAAPAQLESLRVAPATAPQGRESRPDPWSRGN